MKEILALLLVAGICLSLAACGDGAPSTGNSAPDYRLVEITMDNWTEYLTFTSTYSVKYKESAFDDASGEPEWVEVHFLLAVKNEYYSRLDTQNSTITVKIAEDFGTQYGTFSEDCATFEPTGEFQGSPLTFESSEFTNDGERFALNCSTGFAGTHEIPKGQMEKYVKNQEVLNIMGTLLIAQ